MSYETAEVYEQNQPYVYRQQQETVANTLGDLAVNLVLFNGLFLGGLGPAAHTVSTLGAPDSFAHATAAVAEVNNLAPARNGPRLIEKSSKI